MTEQQEKRCWICGHKHPITEMLEVGGRYYCSDECLNEFMLEKD